MRAVLAGDLGGTKCRFALVTEDLVVIGSRQVQTPSTAEELLAAIEGAFTALERDRPAGIEAPAALAFGTAGVVSPDQHRVVAPNLPLGEVDLPATLGRSFGRPVTVLNDGRASALGEYISGPAAGQDPLLALYFGTGVGIGLVVDGRPYDGATNAAGEIGHTLFQPGGRLCVCGRRGCFESLCGGRAIEQRAEEAFGPDPERWTVDKVRQRAGADPVARGILDDAVHAASVLVANACTLLNPSAIVLGGGVARGWAAFRAGVEAFTRDHCAGAVTRELEFYLSVDDSEAILRGAAKAAGVW